MSLHYLIYLLPLSIIMMLLLGTAHAHFTLSAPAPSREKQAYPGSNTQYYPIGGGSTLRPKLDCLQYPRGEVASLQGGSTTNFVFDIGNHAAHVGMCYASLIDISTGATQDLGSLKDCVHNGQEMPITLPTSTCADCVVKIKVTATHLSASNPEYYDSCVDVNISGSGGSSASATSAAATPTTSSDANSESTTSAATTLSDTYTSESTTTAATTSSTVDTSESTAVATTSSTVDTSESTTTTAAATASSESEASLQSVGDRDVDATTTSSTPSTDSASTASTTSPAAASTDSATSTTASTTVSAAASTSSSSLSGATTSPTSGASSPRTQSGDGNRRHPRRSSGRFGHH